MMQTMNLGTSNVTTCHSVGARTAMIPPAFLVDQNGKKHFRSVCKARGVADDHTAQTAYLLIPEDATHGHVLKCSHPKCIQTGRAFRYCAVCRMPVTKRNFHRRHDHGLVTYDEDGRPVLPEDDKEAPPTFTESKKPVVSRPFTAIETTSSDLVQERPTKRPRHVRTVSREKMPWDQLTLAENGLMLNPVCNATGDADVEGDKLSCGVLQKNEMGWLKLFHQRPFDSPNDPTAMSTWISSVMGMAFPKEEDSKPSPSEAVSEDSKPSPSEAVSDQEVSNPPAVNQPEQEQIIDLDESDIAALETLFRDELVPAFDDSSSPTFYCV